MLGKKSDCTPRRCSFATRTWSSARRTSGLLAPPASCCASSNVMRRTSAGASPEFRAKDDPPLLPFLPKLPACGSALFVLAPGRGGKVTRSGTPAVAGNDGTGLDMVADGSCAATTPLNRAQAARATQLCRQPARNVCAYLHG